MAIIITGMLVPGSEFCNRIIKDDISCRFKLPPGGRPGPRLRQRSSWTRTRRPLLIAALMRRLRLGPVQAGQSVTVNVTGDRRPLAGDCQPEWNSDNLVLW